MYSEAKQYQIMGVWSRESFILGPCKETGCSCLINPNLLKAFRKAVLYGR